ncbi:hypothetical protein K435DRAFT_351754 [Dendrothele bispora CBS 962.96]|uniref:Gelsolin-like domain-containing protein n=1 Tax=Dendrothele bispora (strain CBS 962.96) TaxID=1314807 RepID=A0A4S8MI34_DENBC|nr:hypothetical protein K435DRAFT_351754 [Dendrothele bispora CBS 962.96]
MSLAAFMGGRATGPRLNKHAPQQDAHDPTKFEQRTAASVAAPHPIFGKGGVAMPGMSGGSERFSARSSDNVESSATSISFSNGPSSHSNEVRQSVEPSADRPVDRPVSPQKTGGRERSTSIPEVKPIMTGASARLSSAASRYKDEELISAQRTGSRDRTLSTPSYDFQPPMSPPAFRNNVASRYTEAIKDRPVSPQKMGARERTLSTPKPSFSVSSNSDDESAKIRRPVSVSSTRSKTGDNSSPSKPNSPPHHSLISTPSLAGPIRPQPRTSLGPQISTSPTPSPAFLKPPPEKEPTPSLSRLKGRGFVQNMVKASLQLEVASPSSSQASTPEKPGSGGKKSSVLDRWQHQGSSSPPISSPPASPKPIAVRKTRTIDSPVPSASPEPSPKPSPKPKALKPSVSFSSMTETIPPEAKKPELAPKPKGLKPSVSFSNLPSSEGDRSKVPKQPSVGNPGLGSATTLVVFKPESNIAPFIDVSELGVKQNPASLSARNIPVSSGKPLIHPTRDRARKPKKQGSGIKHEEPSPASTTAPALMPSLTRPEATAVDLPSPKAPQLDMGSGSSSTSRAIDTSVNGHSGRVVDRWANQPIIGVKPVLSREPSSSSDSERLKAAGMLGRKALPGLATSPGEPGVGTPPKSPVISRSPSQELSHATPFPSSGPKFPSEHRGPAAPRSRIPSTGNRPTVMDVVETMKARSVSPEPQPAFEEKPRSPETIVLPEPIPEPILEAAPEPVPQLRTPPMEKRKSSYERYSAIIMPPLKEEATPDSTPVPSLTRTVQEHPSIREIFGNDVAQIETAPKKPSRIMNISHVDEPLPKINIEALTKSHAKRKEPDLNTISVEVMSISGNASTAISPPFNVFYDSELLAIVHRAKSKTDGLVTTNVWGWRGKNCLAYENEEQKLEELAKRYGTSPAIINQYHEPTDLHRVLGGQLTIRQGVRAHWSADNTTMHVIRSKNGIIHIDEVDLTAKNLCSGFSYCLTILETIYVWHGVGSTGPEREAARRYGKSLSDNVVEMIQGENDGDEMFWMVLGSEEYAQAHYWKWRPAAADIETRVWRVDVNRAKDAVISVPFLRSNEIVRNVFIIDCVWELFVLVGRKARGNRDDIRLALSVATQYAAHVASRRPFKPPVHVVVLPSQLPSDLRLHFRELDEITLNDNDVPDHMNLMSTEEALDHLRRKSWETFALRDASFLPLGMDPSQIN